jgi:hypothetical protein
MKPDLRSSFQLNNIRAPLIINVGVWGNSIPGSDEFIRLNRLVEKQVLAMNGKKWSYAHSYFTNDEFWGMYDKAKYDALRKKYSATHLSTMYDKLTVTTKVPIQRKKAVIKTLFGLAKLSIKD